MKNHLVFQDFACLRFLIGLAKPLALLYRQIHTLGDQLVTLLSTTDV